MTTINYTKSPICTPDIYHRRYDLDFPTSKPEWEELSKRTALIVLPFISLYRPAGTALSLGMGSVRTFSCLWEAKEAKDWKNCSIQLIHGALAAITVASTFFHFPLGLGISTAFDALQGAYNIYAYSENPQKMAEELLQTLSSVLYLSFMLSGGMEIQLTFALVQASLSLFQSYNELSEERYLEAVGKFAFGCVQFKHAKEIANQIQQRNIQQKNIQRRNALIASTSLTDSREETSQLGTIHFAEKTGEVKKEFTQSIANAKHSIVCMTFTFSDKELLDLLLKKQKEGIGITLVIDQNHMEFASPHASKFTLLTRAKGEGRLHHKITVIDQSTVWIGSANLSPDALTTQSNTMIRLESPQMAKALHEEMEVFAGLRTRSATPPPLFNIEEQNIELLLFPHVPVNVQNSPEKALNAYGRKRILDLINQSKTSLKIAACVWTDPDIAQAVVNAKKRGVNVEVLLWKAAESLAVYSQLKNAGIAVQEKPQLPLMHNKWMLVDNTTFYNGSANWSKSWFSRNDESGVILNNLNKFQTEAIQTYWKKLST